MKTSPITSWRSQKALCSLLGKTGHIITFSTSSKVSGRYVALVQIDSSKDILPVEICDILPDQKIHCGDQIELVLRKNTLDKNDFIEYQLKGKIIF